MEEKAIFGLLAGVSFLAILFTEQGTYDWRLFGFFGLIFGFIWMKVK